MLILAPDPGGVITNADGSMPSGWQNAGNQVTLVATPTTGFVFAGWDADCASAGTGPACQLTMSQPYNAVAHFVPATQ